jgi:hypothetical protein
MSDDLVLKAKLFHPILVILCSVIAVPLFLYFSFLALKSWFAGENGSVIGLCFILITTAGLFIWGHNAIKSVLLRPKIVLSTEGVYFDVSRKSRSWGTIPHEDIIGLAAIRNKRADNYIFLYLSDQSMLYNQARKDRFLGGRFLKVYCRYIDNASNIVDILAEKKGLPPAAAPLIYLRGQTTI